jgi:hypothetical protein
MFGAATERATRPTRQGQARAGPAGARGRGQQRAKGGDNNLPSLLALSRVKTDQFTSRISTGINTIRSWGKQEHEVAALK